MYAESSAPFNVQVTYTTKPDASPTTATTGFAALPDSSGQCPLGLVAARPWVAQPRSMMPGTDPTQTLPSNFINNGSLNNTVVELNGTAPAHMNIMKETNARACTAVGENGPSDPGGDCSRILLGAGRIVQSNTYQPLTPMICVIPKDLLSGI